jgi:hypothetical protein
LYSINDCLLILNEHLSKYSSQTLNQTAIQPIKLPFSQSKQPTAAINQLISNLITKVIPKLLLIVFDVTKTKFSGL